MWILSLIKDHQTIAVYLAGVLTALAISGVPLSIKKGDLEVQLNTAYADRLNCLFEVEDLKKGGP